MASQNAQWLPWTGAACNTLKFTFVHLTYCPSCQQLPDATNPPKGIMTLRHMCSTGVLHMVGSNEQHVQGCSSVRQTDVYCFTEWGGDLFSSLCFPFFINSILFTKKSVVIVNNLAIEWPRILLNILKLEILRPIQIANRLIKHPIVDEKKPEQKSWPFFWGINYFFE